MFLPVNGLFGWVQTNDRRSIALFSGFAVALNVAAVLLLFLPLLALDPDHAPTIDPLGYAMRYVPAVTLAAAGVFALQMFLHVKSVQRSVAFAFVDDADEPRLCGLIEPLAISMGLPAPYVGVIESRALNAFACGLSRRDAVVVVTRGLIEALDDDELAAVLAHELAHIANGDIRLLAAANACLRMIGWMVTPQRKRASRVRELMAFPAIMVVMPPLFLFVLILGFCGQSALRGSRLIRLLITSSREFIADARAVEATQNPAALLSALQRIEGRSHLADLSPGQDAMMIDGACHGAFATHPTIARRIEAIVAVTGSLALIAPPRRDTRPAGRLAPAGSAIQAELFGGSFDKGSVAIRSHSVPSHAAGGKERNWLGLTTTASFGAVLGVALFIGLHWRDLGRPDVLVTALDPRPAVALFTVAGRATTCNAGAMAKLFLDWGMPTQCEGAAMQKFIVAQSGVNGPAGAMLSATTQAPEDIHIHPSGHFSTTLPKTVEAAEVQSKRCFRTQSYTPGDRGWHRVDDPPRRDNDFIIDIRRWLAETETMAEVAGATEPGQSDKPLKAYIEGRKLHYELVDRFFGDAGVALAHRSFASAAHARALARLRERLADPRWAASLPPVVLAEATLLASSPDDFVTCMARRRMAAQHP